MGNQVALSIRLRNALSARLFRIRYGRSLAAFGPGTNVVRPEMLIGARYISIGAGVVIAPNAYLAAMEIIPGNKPNLTIEDGTRIGRNNHIFATNQIHIGKRVLTAGNVYIADNSHGYEDPDVAILDQPLLQLAPVSIGDGTWIGNGASVLGASVGRNCVVGAGAVLRSNVPDHCLVVGAPARIVKRYDRVQGRWRRTQPDGSFCNGGD